MVVAEALKRLDFRDPRTMALQASVAVPNCAGVNHVDFSIDGRYLIATCEFQSVRDFLQERWWRRRDS